jgi:hypothetical protein
MVLGGFGPWHDDQSAMPAFRHVLSDDEIAAVANYVRTAWGNKGAADADANLVARLSAETDTQITLDAGTMQAALRDGGAVQNFDEVTGLFQRTGDKLNCQLDADLVAADPSKDIHLAGICGQDGTVVNAMASSNGQTMPVVLTLQGDGPVIQLGGKLADGSYFTASIDVVSTND